MANSMGKQRELGQEGGLGGTGEGDSRAGNDKVRPRKGRSRSTKRGGEKVGALGEFVRDLERVPSEGIEFVRSNLVMGGRVWWGEG